MQTSRNTIPVLMEPESVNIPNVLTIISGIQKAAAQHGANTRVYLDTDTLLKDQQGSSTVILTGFDSPRLRQIMDTLERAHKKAVMTNVDADHVDAHYSCVTFSRRLTTEQMLAYLLRKGAESIALLGCGVGSANDDIHVQAMKNYLERHGISCGEVFYYNQKVIESFDAFSAKKNQFDTILCVNPYVAVSFLHYCESHDIRIPDDYLLASLKDSCSCRLCKPSITSLFENMSLIGEQSTVIWSYLEHNPSDDLRMRIAVMGSVIERESTRGERKPNTRGAYSAGTDAGYEGGPFYYDETIRNAFTLERCLAQCDELDRQIIALLLKDHTFDDISETLFLSRSALQYRINKLYQSVGLKGKREFVQFFRECFTREHHLET